MKFLEGLGVAQGTIYEIVVVICVIILRNFLKD